MPNKSEHNLGQTTIMKLKLFIDLIDALSKVSDVLKFIINPSKAEKVQASS